MFFFPSNLLLFLPNSVFQYFAGFHLMVSLDFNNQKVFSILFICFPRNTVVLHFLLNKWSFCGLIFTVTCPYRVLIQVYWPTFDLLIQKIPWHSVLYSKFCFYDWILHHICGNHRSPTISYTLNSVNYYPFILTIVIGSNEKNKNKK